MISISARTFDLDGHLIIREDSSTIYPELTRRLSRTATLDGNSSINDSGYSVGDQEYIIEASRMTDNDITKLEHIIKNYSVIMLSSKGGVFLGAIKSIKTTLTPIEIIILISKQISEEG